MNVKRIGGVVAIVLGALILSVALYANYRLKEVKKQIHKSSGLYSDNPLNKGIEGILEKKISTYDAPITWGMIGGIVLIIAGTGTLIYCRRR